MSSPRHDFYENPPTTRAQLREYYTSWLNPIVDASAVEIHGGTFAPVAGFRRGSCIHTVYRNTTSGEYIWYVAEDTVEDFDGWPTRSYPSLEALLDNVVEETAARWPASL